MHSCLRLTYAALYDALQASVGSVCKIVQLGVHALPLAIIRERAQHSQLSGLSGHIRPTLAS